MFVLLRDIEAYVISTEIACTDLFIVYSKTCLKRPLKKTKKWLSCQSLNAGLKYCRMLQESILQYDQSSLSYHLLLSLCFVYYSGLFTQVLLYVICTELACTDLFIVYVKVVLCCN